MSASKEEEKKCLEYAKKGQLESLAGVVERFPSIVHCVDSLFRTPLHFAAWNGHLSVVEYLLQHQANVHCVDSDG